MPTKSHQPPTAKPAPVHRRTRSHSAKPAKGRVGGWLRDSAAAALVVILLLVTSFSRPTPATAQFGLVFDVIANIDRIYNNVKEAVKDIGTAAAGPAIISAGTSFLNQLAYKSAVALTTDCPGQTPCWDSKSIKQSVQDAAKGAVGEFVGVLSDRSGLTDLGFDLCDPPDLPGLGVNFKLNLSLGLIDQVQPKPPRCDFKNIVENWDSVRDSLDTEELLGQFSSTFNVGQTPLSTATGVQTALSLKVAADAEDARLQRLIDAAAGGGFTGLNDPVSGRQKSPGAVTQGVFSDLQYYQGRAKQDVTNAIISGQLASKSVTSLLPTVLVTFGQTLLTGLWNNFAQGLISSEELIIAQPDIIFNPEGGLASPGAIGARLAQSRFFAPPPRDLGIVDPTLEFTVCPPIQGGGERGVKNCVMDQGFSDAVHQEVFEPLTVAAAIEKGFLHGDWLLSSAADKAWDTKVDCFNQRYCESNLKKLRAARIIPIGWEIAASLSPIGQEVSLSTVVDGFRKCNPVTGQADAENPWCHLIDPDWVLKAPLAYCRAQVFGPQLLAANTAGRAETCVDQPSCVDKDSEGNCIWGFCTEEQRTWRFNGDSCPAQFASCRTLSKQGGNGEKSNFLLNTVGSQSCTADNVGCDQFFTQANPNPATPDLAFAAKGPSRFFNAKAENCNSADGGCTTLVSLAPRESLNLIRNGSFERLVDGDLDGSNDHPEGWTPFGQVPAGQVGSITDRAASGSNAMLVGSETQPAACQLSAVCNKAEGCTCLSAGYSCAVSFGDTSCPVTNQVWQPGLPVKPNTSYVVSATFIPPTEDQEASGEINLHFTNSTGAPISITTSTASLNADETVGASGSCDVSGGSIQVRHGSADAGNSVRSVCNFIVTNPDIALATIEVAGQDPVIVDDVQLEEGPLTPFHDGYGTANSIVHAKIAPPEFGCDGSADDPAQCQNFAQSCNESEVGCEAYTPTNGDPFVPGIISSQDRCPAECAGFATFKQQASTFDAERFPVYFIPSTARACSAAEVGCSEFTNTTNEQRSYFSELRICQKPTDPGTATFYSWEGSDTTGFQLRVWSLKESNINAVASANDSDISAVTGSSDLGRAPCTAYDAQSGNCVESAAVTPLGACDRSQTLTNPDCREFYDRDGNRHYRLLSKTIIATDECTSFRATGATEGDCSKSSGRWDDASAICFYQSAPSESTSCSAAANSCRAYQGDAAAGSRAVFNDDFESGVGNWQNGTQSSEAVTVGGHSLKLASAGRVERTILGSLLPNRSYSLTFWARGNGAVNIGIDNGRSGDVHLLFTDSDTSTATPGINLTAQWRQYSVGPVIVNNLAFLSGTTQFLSFESTDGAFFDNVLLKETADSFFVVRDSWITPASCNRTSQGSFAPLAQLGCQAYTDSQSRSAFLKSFSNLCREEAIGCGAFSLTHNTTTNPYAETFNATCQAATACTDPAACPCNYQLTNPAGGAVVKLPDVCRIPNGQTSCRFNLNSNLQPANPVITADAVPVPADSRAYLVIRSQDRCDASAASCRVMGKPHYSYEQVQGGVVVGLTTPIIDRWETVAKKDDPAKYTSILCGAGEVGCAAWNAANGGGQFFFKDPGSQTCTYQENVNFEGKNVFGWFRTSESGSILPCYEDILKNGDYFDIARNGDANYQGWVGQCTDTADRCEEFIDPLDTTKDNAAGKPYYFLMNNKLDLESCTGKGSLKEGCVLFNQTSIAAKNFSAAGTYFESEKNFNGQATPAVDCDSAVGEASPACAKRCTGIANGVCSTSRAACDQNSDCSGTQVCVGAVTLGDACVDDGQCNTARGESCKPPATNPSAGFDNDANVIIKVQPDRECAQWFACSAEQTVYDAQQNKWRSICTGFDLCEESRGSGQASECAKWVDSQPVRLTREVYVDRDITWRGREFSGFSIYNAFPLNLIKPVTVSKLVSAAVPASPGVPSQPAIFTNENRFGVVVDPSFRCTAINDNPLLNDCPTILTVTGEDKAACIKNLCVRELTGGPLRLNTVDITNRPQCRAYPEVDSPFPRKILLRDNVSFTNPLLGNLSPKFFDTTKTIERRAAFQGANICEFGEDCECSYLRGTFGQSPANAKFVSLNGGSLPGGICTGGPKDGLPCNPNTPPAAGDNDSCGEASLGGLCIAKTAEARVVGWQGLCVDYDKSITLNGDVNRNACNLWLPVDQLAGAPDIFNQNVQAGFESPKSQLLYCQASTGSMRASAVNGPMSYDITPYSEDPSGAKDLGGASGCNNGRYLLQASVDCGLSDPNNANSVENNKVEFDQDNPANTAPSNNVVRPYFAKRDIAGIRIEFVGSDMQTSGNPPVQKFMYLLPRPTNDLSEDAWFNGGYFSGQGEHNLGSTSANNTTGAIATGLNSDETLGAGATDPCISLLDTRQETDTNDDPNDRSSHEDTCDRDILTRTGKNHCFIVKAKFTNDPSGNKALDKISGALCTDRGGLQHFSVPVKITILLKEQCTDLNLLHDARNVDDDGVAWPSAVYTDTYDKARTAGTLDAVAVNASDTNLVPGYSINPLSNRFAPTLSNLPFGPATFKDDLYRDPINLPMFPIALADPATPTDHPDNIQVNTAKTDYEPVAGLTSAGTPFACVGPCKQPVASSRGSATEFGAKQLKQLFAVNLRYFRANNLSNFVYAEQLRNAFFGWNQTGEPFGDSRKKNTAIDQAPKVLAVDVRNCLGDGRCPELGPGLTVNNSTSGTVEGVGGRLKATIRYYAFADPQHMPIRRKVMDFFGGGEQAGGVVATNGFYKNHRGLRIDPTDQTLKDVCVANPDATTSFGLTPDTCDTYYFEDSKTYICNDALLTGTVDSDGNVVVNQLPACGTSAGYPCQRNNACVYKPRVHITDAWGVCNGNCGSGANPAICINTNLGKDDPLNNVAGTPTAPATNLATSCNYRGNSNSWTSFAGEIVVKP